MNSQQITDTLVQWLLAPVSAPQGIIVFLVLLIVWFAARSAGHAASSREKSVRIEALQEENETNCGDLVTMDGRLQDITDRLLDKVVKKEEETK